VQNSETVSGMHLSLGKAIGVVGISMIGCKFSVQEQRNHHLRLQIFENAARYCLDPGDWEMIMSSEPAVVQQFILNMCISQTKSLFVDLFAVVRQHFQDNVFGPVQRNPDLQKHLGLDMTKCVCDK